MELITVSWDLDVAESVPGDGDYAPHHERFNLPEIAGLAGIQVRKCLPYGRVYLSLDGVEIGIREGDVFDVRDVQTADVVVRDIPNGYSDGVGGYGLLAAMDHASQPQLEILGRGDCPWSAAQQTGRPLPAALFWLTIDDAISDTFFFPWPVVELVGAHVKADAVPAEFYVEGGGYGLAHKKIWHWEPDAVGHISFEPPEPVLLQNEDGQNHGFPGVFASLGGAGGDHLQASIYCRPVL